MIRTREIRGNGAITEQLQAAAEQDAMGHDLLGLRALSSVVRERAGIASRLGKQFGTARDVYEVAGYPKAITFDEYAARYERQDVAGRVVDAKPDATWREPPVVMESEDNIITPFESAWADLSKTSRIYHYLRRADTLAGIGSYGILLIGFDDGAELGEEVTKAGEILYLQPYDQGKVHIVSRVRDVRSPRYTLPEMYKVEDTDDKSSNGILIHASRVLHIADGAGSSDTFGTPRLQKVFNRLIDLEKVMAACGEMFWQGAVPGLAFKLAEDAEPNQDLDEYEGQIENYVHGLQRYLKLQGIDIQEIKPNIADPRPSTEVLVQMISAATGIPSRILTGSEQAQLASSQDKENWLDRIAERRELWAEPMVLRPLIDKLISLEVLPEPNEVYSIEWDDVHALTEGEKADISLVKTKAMSEYIKGDISQLMTAHHYLVKVMGMDQDEAEAMLQEVGKEMDEEDAEALDAEAVASEPAEEGTLDPEAA